MKEEDLPVIKVGYTKPIKSKIEKAGKQVIHHLIKLGVETDLSYEEMAQKINGLYNIGISRYNVVHFFKTNMEAIRKVSEEKKYLGKMRANYFLDHYSVLVGDIKTLDSQIDELVDDQLIESDKKAKVIGDLIDKKGRLLLRQARLSGNLRDQAPENVQVNIFQQINNEKSDIINRLKKAEFNPEKVIDVE